jgi:putative flavoprotein involved in K+ transport
MEREHFNTVIIGAGQAGLAAGYFLKKINDDFIILDEENQIGDSWRRRWDSLTLFTPSEHDGLPGFPFPAKHGSMPTKNQMADYLSNYVQKFSLPVSLNSKVIELQKNSDSYEISTSKGKLISDNVIVATGTNPVAYIPAFASKLNKRIVQIHSADYKNPESFPAKNTLVVGAGTSGVEIAIELSKSRPTMISGKGTPHIPDFAFRYLGKPYWLFIHHILTLKTPIGRKAKPKIIDGGAPLISVSMKNVKEAQVEQLPRVKGVKNGFPEIEDGRIISVESIVWATGYKPDFSWIKFNVTGDNGWPQAPRGISTENKGLFFMGMVFQFGLTSGLVGGVGRDAAFVVNHIKKTKTK